MATRTLRDIWRDGGAALGGWCMIPSTLSAEAMARAGFDYVCVDLQHGLAGMDMGPAMLQAVDLGDAVPIARVPWNEPSIMHRVLDSGALGVIVPMVNSPEEAALAVDSCRYGPAGSRSFGPMRVSMRDGPDYFAGANDRVAVIIQIETREAIDAIDDILAVPGVDCAYIGPQDLQVSLGLAPAYHAEDPPALADALSRMLAACDKAGVVPGIHSNARLGAKRVKEGFRMVTVSSDFGALRTTAAAEIAEVRQGVKAG